MNRQHKRRNWLGIAIFLILVAISGYALAATHNLDNPLDELNFLLTDSGRFDGAGQADSSIQAPANDAPRPSPDGGEGGAETSSISWSRLGGVLSDIWFLCAITAAVIVIQLILDFSRSLIAQLQSPAHLTLNVKRVGLSTALAAVIIGYSLYQQSISKVGASSLDSSTTQPPVALQTTPRNSGRYKDGEYTGETIYAGSWGNIQVKAVIQNGQITDIQLLDFPQGRSFSNRISQIALPYLIEEAIQAQSASVDIISGATPTSQAFMMSLQSALINADNTISTNA